MKSYSYCPSCQKQYTDEETPHSGPLICSDCVELRDKKIIHTEEDVQEVIKRQTDDTIRRSWR